MQLTEAALACWYKNCCTGIVLERFFVVPGKETLAVLSSTVFSREAVEFMRGLGTQSVKALTSWPTMLSFCEQEAKKDGDGDFLRAKLREVRREGGCVTFNRLTALFGNKLHSITDALKQPPRLKQLKRVKKELHRLSINDPHLIMTQDRLVKIRRVLMLWIKGDHYGSYVRPTDEVLADGAWIELIILLNNVDPINGAVYLERATLNALKKCYPEWVADTIDMENGIQCVPGDENALALYRTKENGTRIIVTNSYFVAFAEETDDEVRRKSVRGYLAHLRLQRDSGNLSAVQCEKQEKLLEAFLIALKKDDFRDGRYRAFPLGYFLGAPERTLIISKKLGIGYLEMLWLRHELGYHAFGVLLHAFGLKHPSPVEVDFVCKGTPAVGDMPAQTCPYEADEIELITMVGGGIGPDHSFYGHYVCWNCRRKYERLEYAHLRNKEVRTAVEENRLGLLESYKQSHRDRANERRENHIASLGLEAVQEGERKTYLNSREQRMDRMETDPEYAQQQYDYVKKKDRERKMKNPDAAAKRKSNGGHRFVEGHASYPPSVQSKLDYAIARFVVLRNSKSINWNTVCNLFDKIVEKEKNVIDATDGFPNVEYMVCHGNRKVVAQVKAYVAAANTVLTKSVAQTKGNMWIWNGYKSGQPSRGKIADLQDMIVGEMYP